jgi:hypothetical protein
MSDTVELQLHLRCIARMTNHTRITASRPALPVALAITTS